ncbi:MAG: hypothetical protein JSW39_28485 [Desulfobacterales bacterium]|nr:MAG: hypothetical protein JSW39_28485 [Desulfobacterales bacterium]
MQTIHVRWRRQVPPEGQRGSHFLTAELVQACDEPVPAQALVIKKLATIDERFLTTRARDARIFHQGLFWAAARRELDALELTPQVRREVETALAERVPRPPRGDWALQGITCTIRYDPQ